MILLEGPEPGTPVDLTGASVNLIVAPWPRFGVVGDPIIEGTMTGWAGAAFGASGEAEYEWVDGDLATAGQFAMEYEVLFADATLRTFPARGYDQLTILPDLGPSTS